MQKNELKSLIEETIRRVLGEIIPLRTEWIDRNETKKQLGIRSDTTLQELRDKGCIRFSKMGKIIMYDKSSIEDYLSRNANYKPLNP